MSRLKLTEVDSGAPISSLNFPPLIMSTLIAGQNIVKALKRERSVNGLLTLYALLME